MTFIRTKLKYILIFLLVAGVLVVALEKLHVINLYEKKRLETTQQNTAQTTSTAESAQADFTQGGEKKVNTPSTQEGTASDNNGSVPNIPSESNWTKSSDGKITVYSPSKSSLVTSGFALSGASSYQTIYFRLIDNISGVISQGSVKVVSGKYSATFSFSTKATNGRLDVFYANTDGVESSSISIPVRYQ